jgi:hypothetical protein
MKIEEFAPIPPARLKGIRWKGERAYQVLSYSFSVRWNGELTEDSVEYVFGRFAVARPKGPAGNSNGANVYSLLDLGPREPRRYRLMLADQQLISSRNADDVLNQLFFQIPSHMLDLTEDFLLIHAGSVVTPRGDAVLLPGNAGAGKSTLVTGLIRAGFGFLSDEVGVIDHQAGVLRPYPRALSFKEGAVTIFPDLRHDHGSPFPGNRGYLRAEEIRPDAMAAPSEVRFVIAPRYEEGAATRVTALSPGATVKELWTHTLNLGAYRVGALTILADVARGARGYRLVSGDLKEAVRAVDQLTGPAGAGFSPVSSG